MCYISFHTYKWNPSSALLSVHQTPPKTSLCCGGQYDNPPHKLCSMEVWKQKTVNVVHIVDPGMWRHSCFWLYLLQFCPIVDLVAHQDSTQLLWPKQLHQISVTHLEEASLELLKHTLHWFIEDIIHVSIHKLPSVTQIKDSKNIIRVKVKWTGSFSKIAFLQSYLFWLVTGFPGFWGSNAIFVPSQVIC